LQRETPRGKKSDRNREDFYARNMNKPKQQRSETWTQIDLCNETMSGKSLIVFVSARGTIFNQALVEIE